jgi:hypothetical protein
MAAIRDASNLEAAIEHVVSLLNGAISDRGCAIATMPMQVIVAMCQKFGRRFGRAKALAAVDTSHCSYLQHTFFYPNRQELFYDYPPVYWLCGLKTTRFRYQCIPLPQVVTNDGKRRRIKTTTLEVTTIHEVNERTFPGMRHWRL